ncbi:MAG: hypothetical protein ACTSQJ_01035 [Promethearchaeota archaeon]
MSLNNETEIFSKIKRSAEKTNIHNLFIFNKSGICIYCRNFTKSYNMEENLISSFFTALMSFTKEIMGNKIKTIEMAGIKFVIIEKRMFYYGLLCDSIENLIMIENLISQINSEFLNFIRINDINYNSEFIDDKILDGIIDSIIKENLSNEFDIQKEEKIIKFLKKMSLNEEINGIILLTDKGKVLYSSINKLDLKIFLKEIDFRVKICNNTILKMFYTSKNKELIFSEYIEDLYFIILVFDLRTKFGVAEYYLLKVVKFIRKILNS